MKRIENYDVLLALRPISGGQLVALSGLRQVSSEKEESISASDKCWDQDLRRGTANVQNNTVAPTSEEGSWYILWIVVVPANWNIMSERQIYHTYFTDCWLETGGGPCMCIPFFFYSLWSHLLPWFLFSLVSSCLFRRGGGKAAAAQSESVQFKCRTKAMSPRLCSGMLPPLLCCICNKCPPRRLRDDRT